MPTLLDALASLATQCALIASLSDANTVPAGPFTTAQLQGNTNIMSIIRDAEEHEKRLFRYVGDDGAGPGKVVEKRAKGVVTPLRNGLGGHLKGAGGQGTGRVKAVGRAEDEDDAAGWNDPGVLLKTALKLVDEYRPMPRAREHIIALLGQYADTQSAIAVLEDNIEESGLPSKRSAIVSDSLFDELEPEFLVDEDDEHDQTERMTPEEWLKKEEEALKAMEAEVAELRKQRASQSAAPRTPISPRVNKASPSPRSALPPASNGSRLAASPASPKLALRPAPASSGKQPSPSPSPLAATFGRSTELARSPVAGQSASADRKEAFATRGLASSTPGKLAMPQPNISPAHYTATASPSRLEVPGSPSMPAPPLGLSPRRAASPTLSGPTPRYPPRQASLGRSAGKSPATPTRTPLISLDADPSGTAETTPTPRAKTVFGPPPSAHKRKVVEGIEIRSDVRSAVNKIWSTLGEVLRQGEDSPSPEHTLGTAESIKHMANLAQSPLPPPLSPSTTSTVSSLPLPGAPPAPYRSPPLTSTTILTCALLLAMLQAPGLAAQMSDLKESLGAIAAARGWDKDMATKVIYGAVAKRTVKIDRRGGGGGKVLFSI